MNIYIIMRIIHRKKGKENQERKKARKKERKTERKKDRQTDRQRERERGRERWRVMFGYIWTSNPRVLSTRLQELEKLSPELLQLSDGSTKGGSHFNNIIYGRHIYIYIHTYTHIDMLID